MNPLVLKKRKKKSKIDQRSYLIFDQNQQGSRHARSRITASRGAVVVVPEQLWNPNPWEICLSGSLRRAPSYLGPSTRPG